MILFLINIVLALVWTVVSGSFTFLNLVFGFLLGAASLYLIRREIGTAGYVGRAFRIGSLFLLFLRELLMSAWRVAVMVLRPQLALTPGIFAYRLKVERDFEISLLANLITLTPGTLVVDISPDGKWLYLHCMYAQDPASTLAEIDDLALRLRKAVFS